MTALSETSNLGTIQNGYPSSSQKNDILNDDMLQADVSEEDEQLGTTRLRFVLVTLFACYALMNQVGYVSFSTIVREAQEKYSLSAFLINFLSLLIPVVYIIGVIPGAWVFGKIGLRWTIVAGMTATAISSILKLISTWSESYGWLIAAQILVALGQIFYFALPTTFAETWFPVKERTFATAIVSLAGFVGMAVGMFYSPYVVHVPNKVSKGSWAALWGSQCGFAVVTTVLILLVFPSKPEKKPSHTTAEPPDVGMLWRGLKSLFRSRNTLIITASFGLSLGTLTGVAAMLTQLLEPFGVAETKSGILAFAGLMAGSLNCAVFGIIVDRTHRYKITILTLLGVGVAIMVILVVLTKTAPHNAVAIGSYVLIPLLNLVVLPIMPVTMEFSVEVSYPHPPVVGTTMILTAMCFVSFIVMIVFSVILGDAPTTNDTFICFMIVLVAMVVSFVGFLFSKEKLKRASQEDGTHFAVGDTEPMSGKLELTAQVEDNPRTDSMDVS